ncbi:MAG: translocation/assembly module TamB domain-containing protein [Myxococcota bacterium]
MKILRAVVGGLARGVALLALLALLLPALLVLYTTTDDFRARLLARLEPELDDRMAGDLSIGGLAGSPLSRLRFVDVALAWHDEPIARARSIAIGVDWTALLFGRVEIARVDIEAPEVVFREHAALGWDWRDALAPLIPAPDPERPPRNTPQPVVVETLAISDATLTIAAQARPEIRLDGLAARGRLDFEQRRLRIDEASLALGRSQLSATGEVPFEGRYVFDVTIGSLHPADLARIDPALAESLAFLAPASGELVLRGDKQALDATGQLLWPETKLTFDLHGDPRALGLPRSTIVARLESADLARFAPALGIAGPLDLRLELANGEGTFGAHLRSGSQGELAAEGLVALLGTPETKLQFTAKRFDLAHAFPGHPEWASALDGRGTLDLRRRERSALEGALTLQLGASRIGELALRSAEVRATLSGDTIDLAELVLDSPIGRVEADGSLSTKPGRPLTLSARLAIDDLAPLLALVRQEGSGRLVGDLALDGPPERARLAADLALSDFRLGSFQTAAAHLDLVARGGFAQGQLDATIETFRLETALGDWSLDRATRLTAARDALAFDDARFSSGEARIALDGRIGRRGRQDLRLEARALPIAAWARANPALVSPEVLAGGVLDVDLEIGGVGAAPRVEAQLVPRGLVVSEEPIETASLTLRYAERRAEAQLAASTSPDLRFDAEARLPFALAWEQGFAAKPVGELVARATCEAGDLAVLQGFVEERIKALGGRGRCELALEGPLDALRPSGRIEASDLTGRPARTGVTLIAGELAVEIAEDRFFVRRATATVEGYEDSARFRAEGEGPLPVFLTRLIRPTPAGEQPGEADAPPEGGGPAGDGNAPAIDEPAAQVADAPVARGDYVTQIELKRWPLVDTKRDRLIASGKLRARGTFERPRVEGRVSIVEGTLRPNLSFLSSGPPPRDPTIVFEGEGRGPNGGVSESPTSNLLSTFEALELEVDIDVGRDLWIKHEQAEALLDGRIEARKARNKPLSLAGRIDAQQGFFDLQNRRFRLIEGGLELVGGAKIDPQLDLLARYRAPAHTIDARLSGTASKPVLTLSSDPSLSQEDILAVLLFGRPAGELTAEQQVSVGQRAEEIASAFGITAVGRTVASAIGLDALGLQIEELSSARARVGAYVGRNIFVALGQEFSGERGQELSIEYEFLPGWSLVGSTTTQGTNSADLVWRIRY